MRQTFDSLHGSSHSVCRASASHGPQPFGQTNMRLKRAMDDLARFESISDAAYQSLDSFRKNHYRPSSNPVEEAKFDLNEKRLEHKVAKADHDVAKAELVVLKVNKAPASEIAEGQR